LILNQANYCLYKTRTCGGMALTGYPRDVCPIKPMLWGQVGGAN